MRRAHAVSPGALTGELALADASRRSPEGEGGRHTKIRRRLGVSPGPVGFSGPLMPRLFTPAVFASSENRSSTPRALARRTTATPTVCGPAGTFNLTPPRGGV